MLATARLISSHFPARVKGAPPLARVEVDGVDLVASFTVRHQSDGQWYYNAVALHDAKEKAQDSYGRPDQQAGSSVAPIAGLSGFIRRPLAQINPEAVSRVVDPDTSGNEGGDAFTYFDAYASNYGLAAQIWLAIPARNCGALAGLQKQSYMDALALLAVSPSSRCCGVGPQVWASPFQIERSASKVQHLAAGCCVHQSAGN